jgi:hypothetical protein
VSALDNCRTVSEAQNLGTLSKYIAEKLDVYMQHRVLQISNVLAFLELAAMCSSSKLLNQGHMLLHGTRSGDSHRTWP